jgi:hypothetical protein
MKMPAITTFKRFLLRLLAPGISRHLTTLELTLQESEFTNDWLNERLAGLNGLRATISNIASERDDCLNNLVALVAIDDEGFWATVHDADTRLPAEMSEYLTGLVARA